MSPEFNQKTNINTVLHPQNPKPVDAKGGNKRYKLYIIYDVVSYKH